MKCEKYEKFYIQNVLLLLSLLLLDIIISSNIK